MSIRSKVITVGVYDFCFTLLIGPMEEIGKKYNVDVKHNTLGVFFMRFHKSGIPVYYMAMKEDAKAETIVHETVHAVNQIYDLKGIVPDTENDEPQAYLTTFIFRECFEFLNKGSNGNS